MNPDHETEERLFRFAVTGHPIEDQSSLLEFVATFQAQGGSLIFHIFEVKKMEVSGDKRSAAWNDRSYKTGADLSLANLKKGADLIEANLPASPVTY